MEVLNKQITLLTNYEVLDLLNKVKKEEDKKSKNDRSKHLATILYETTKYLKKTPAADQSVEAIEKLIVDVAPYKLTAAETLQLINLRPSTTTEIQLLIEESEERIKTEEKLESLVNVVTDCLPSRPASSMTQ
uniref:DNA-directed RNA polymerase III subunit RPC9 n=1 Tax=Haemonchus contortus TaxID=6289 RepID=A0A7I4Y0Z4_HAECO